MHARGAPPSPRYCHSSERLGDAWLILFGDPDPKPKPKPNPNPNPNPKPHPDPDPKHKPKPKPSPNQVRAKLATRDTDHCDPKDPKGKGCRYEPCVAHPKGLAKALINVADGWRSPLNDPTDKLYLALRPVQP